MKSRGPCVDDPSNEYWLGRGFWGSGGAEKRGNDTAAPKRGMVLMRDDSDKLSKARWIEDELVTADDFAWAFLRRNPDYREEAAQNRKMPQGEKSDTVIYRSGRGDEKARNWGLEFFRRSR